jgi:TRAP-type C4-dicarboxylate transport system permease small subunit
MVKKRKGIGGRKMDFSWLKKINDYVMKLFMIFIALIGTIMVVIVFTNVISRYVFHSTIAWAEELARFLFIWVTFVGAVLASDKSEHMRLDFIVDIFKGKIKKLIELAAYLIVIVLLVFLIHGSARYSMTQWDWESSALGVKHGMVYIIAPISFSVIAVQYFCKFVNAILHFIDQEEEERC